MYQFWCVVYLSVHLSSMSFHSFLSAGSSKAIIAFFLFHDSAVAVSKNGKVQCVLELERLFKIRYFNSIGRPQHLCRRLGEMEGKRLCSSVPEVFRNSGSVDEYDSKWCAQCVIYLVLVCIYVCVSDTQRMYSTRAKHTQANFKQHVCLLWIDGKCMQEWQVYMYDVDEDNCERRTNWLTSLCRQATSQASHDQQGHPLHMHPLDALIDVSTCLERTKEGIQTVLVTGAESGSRTMRMWWWSVSRVFSWRTDCSFSSIFLSLSLSWIAVFFKTEHDWIGASKTCVQHQQSRAIKMTFLGLIWVHVLPANKGSGQPGIQG